MTGTIQQLTLTPEHMLAVHEGRMTPGQAFAAQRRQDDGRSMPVTGRVATLAVASAWCENRVAPLMQRAAGAAGVRLRTIGALAEYKQAMQDPHVATWGVRLPPSWYAAKTEAGADILYLENGLLHQHAGMYCDRRGWFGDSGIRHGREWETPATPAERAAIAAHASRWYRAVPFLGGNPDGPVLVCGQLSRDMGPRFHCPGRPADADPMAWLIATVSAHLRPGVPVVWRRHPKDAADYELPPGWTADQRTPLADALRTCRAVVTVNSSVAAEAVLLGVPVAALGVGCWTGSPAVLDCSADPSRLRELGTWAPDGQADLVAAILRHQVSYDADAQQALQCVPLADWLAAVPEAPRRGCCGGARKAERAGCRECFRKHIGAAWVADGMSGQTTDAAALLARAAVLRHEAQSGYPEHAVLADGCAALAEEALAGAGHRPAANAVRHARRTGAAYPDVPAAVLTVTGRLRDAHRAEAMREAPSAGMAAAVRRGDRYEDVAAMLRDRMTGPVTDFVVTAFATPDEPYLSCLERLRGACGQLGLPHFLRIIEPPAGLAGYARLRWIYSRAPVVAAQAIDAHGLPVLYIDADDELLARPSFPDGVSVGWCRNPEQAVLPTHLWMAPWVYVAPTDTARAWLREWARYCAMVPAGGANHRAMHMAYYACRTLRNADAYRDVTDHLRGCVRMNPAPDGHRRGVLEV